VFSNSTEKTKSYSVSTKGELDKLLLDPEFADTQKMQLVEIHMDQFDAPVGLIKQAELSIAANHYS
jgi:pyruvate decarboxylase